MPLRTYEAIDGFFVQSDPIEATPEYFGLVSKSWPEFASEIDELCSRRSDTISYKVLFLGRHGQGNHNLAEIKHGSKAWNEKWSLINGDGELTWGPDPHLNTVGEDQADNAHDAWEREIRRGIPIPQKFYCSPLTRAMQTLEITFEDILPDHVTPLILENLREEYGEHTCDMRRTQSELESEFPDFDFEDGFEEEDVLWTTKRETKKHSEKRAKQVLDRIFQNDRDDTYISITSHNGWIDACLRVVGRQDFLLPTGGIMALVVKATVLH
ncbi:histidine phosphatase superfamily [Russula compacta]|nr:histidine phosphatase superfamily [Russula compacta]